MCSLCTGRPIQDFAKSCIKVAEHYLRTNGDLQVAREYLKTVAGSNVEEVVRAAELLKEATQEDIEAEERRKASAVVHTS